MDSLLHLLKVVLGHHKVLREGNVNNARIPICSELIQLVVSYDDDIQYICVCFLDSPHPSSPPAAVSYRGCCKPSPCRHGLWCYAALRLRCNLLRRQRRPPDE